VTLKNQETTRNMQRWQIRSEPSRCLVGL